MNPLKHTAAAILLAGIVVAGGCTARSGEASTEAVAALEQQQQEQANIEMVKTFYDLALNVKDYDAASKYLGDKYIQHNPGAADGPEGLRGFITFLKTDFPQSHNEVKHAYADGDRVILHVHSLREPDTLGRAIVDIFRIEDGKVVEHWDVIQDVVAPDQAKNANTMF
jgi:predicted SnoaL-like aldol condensation-catalyzing enzyme